MNQISYTEVCGDADVTNAVLHYHEPFVKDYICLHILLKKHGSKFKRFLEIGTNMGVGTKIIKNALGNKCDVMTLDLPTELAGLSKQHPINEGKGDAVGSLCDLPFIQLRGDSLKYNYKNHYPIDGWFIDGEHDFQHPNHETKEAIKSKAKLIVWHDADMDDVYSGIYDAFIGNNDNYKLFRVTGTRIAYAIKK